MDPFLRETPLERQCNYYPLGFPLQLKTNSAEVLQAAEATWGGRPRAFEKPPLELRIIVESGGGPPPEPVYRGQAHLMSIVADRENFAVCDYARHFAFCRLNTAAVRDQSFVSYYFLEAIANFSLTQLYLTPVHAACVARKGRGVLLSGSSGAGKTTLAYFCAKEGWTYVSDNESWLVRAESRLLLGNPRRIRFRESAAELFPELKRSQAAPHPNGKMSIEVSPDGLETAYQCEVERVVFLSRESGSPATLRAIRSGDALEHFLSELPVYEDWVREEQRISLNRIAELDPVELRYSDPESALRAIESLVA
jgi:Serine kinase of the HPr protein, regulates carbohydrate metabolism